jgi:inner membrane protein
MSAGGLRRRTGLATVTMVIGANLPDVDAIVYLTSDASTGLAFRRGWTHGVLAMAVLPVVLTGLMLLIARIVEAGRAGRPVKRAPLPVRPTQILLLSALSIWSHPLFDLLNTYGVRLLMPFSGRWFYGDALFIIDPWLWCILGLGTAMSLSRARRVPVGAGTTRVMRRVERPARVAMTVVATYIAIMLGTSTLGRALVERQAAASGGGAARHVMVGPAPLTPFTRSVVRELPDRYEIGELSWTIPPRYTPSGRSIEPGLASGSVRAAALSPPAQRFFVWARFPFAESTSSPGGTIVRFDDARYASRGGYSFASTTVAVPNGMGETR